MPTPTAMAPPIAATVSSAARRPWRGVGAGEATVLGRMRGDAGMLAARREAVRWTGACAGSTCIIDARLGASVSEAPCEVGSGLTCSGCASVSVGVGIATSCEASAGAAGASGAAGGPAEAAAIPSAPWSGDDSDPGAAGSRSSPSGAGIRGSVEPW